MSKLFKSKFIFGLVVALALVVSTTVSAYTFTAPTLKMGSKSQAVMELQKVLNANGYTVSATGAGSPGYETTTFGSKTKAAVMKWQAAMGLVADGVVGPASRAVLNGTTSTLPSTTLPAGCTSTAGFSPLTGVSCSSGATTTLPAGCTSTAGFSPLTGQSCAGGSTPSQSGPVSAMLASTNPAAGTLVTGQATADLAHFAFTGSGTVTSVTLKRIGVSADATPSNVYLFDGAMRLTDAASVSNNGQVTFNVPSGIFTVNGSKTISVRSDIAANTSGQTVGMMLATFTAGGTASTVNLSGNIHSIASATLAGVALSGTVTPTGATLNPGPNVTVWQASLNVSQRDVWMKRVAFRNVGSAPANAFANFKLFVNGVQVGTAAGLDINGYVTFDMMANPVMLASGTRMVRVEADIVSGASRTVNFSLRNAADVDFVDSSFGVNVAPTSAPWSPAAESFISGQGGGSLTIEKDVSSPSTNLTLSGNDVKLATYKVTAYGEPIKIETIRATFTASNGAVGSLRNGRLVIGGVQYGSTSTLLEDSTAPGYTTYTLNYTVMPGTPVMLDLHADIFDNDGTNDLVATNTLTGVIAVGVSNAQKVDSLGSLNVPGVAVSGNVLTVAATTVGVTANATYANQSVSLPATAFKIGSWNVSGSSVEDVLLTTLSFDVDANGGGTFTAADLTNMSVVVKDANGDTVANPTPLATVAAADNNFSINYTLVKNTNVVVELFANLGSTVTVGHAVKTDLSVTGTAIVSGTGIAVNDVDGQTITSGTATITATTDASTPVAVIVADNQTVTAAAFRFAAVTAGFNVTDLTFTLANATVAQTVELWDGATMVASRPGAATVTFNGLSWNVPANTNKVLTVRLVLGTVGVGAGTSGSAQTVILTDFTATNTSTGVSDASANDTGPSIENNPAGNVVYAYAAIPTVTNVALPSSILAAGTQALARFTVTSNGGTIGWNRMVFNIVKTSAPTLASATLWDVDSNTQVAGTAVIRDTANAASCLDTLFACRVSFVPTAEQQVSGSKTYELRATVGGILVDNDYVSTNINANTTYVAPTTYILSVPAGSDATYALLGSTSSFSWSDVSAAGHSTSTSDWNNDFLVKNIPTSSQTLSK